MNISKNFTLGELVASQTATKKGIDNTPTAQAVENLTALVVNLLQPLRDIIAVPLGINSGYRCTILNKAVGGAKSSQHLKGEAADVRVSNPGQLLEVLMASGIEFDQAILYPTFLHLSLKSSGVNRNQVIYK